MFSDCKKTHTHCKIQTYGIIKERKYNSPNSNTFCPLITANNNLAYIPKDFIFYAYNLGKFSQQL